MSQPNQELSGDDLAAFDALIGDLEEQGGMSINLRELKRECCYGGQNAFDRYQDEQRDRAERNGLIRFDSLVDPEDIGLDRFDRGVSLAQLIEIRRSLQP